MGGTEMARRDNHLATRQASVARSHEVQGGNAHGRTDGDADVDKIRDGPPGPLDAVLEAAYSVEGRCIYALALENGGWRGFVGARDNDVAG
jgi:hypothetical protein